MFRSMRWGKTRISEIKGGCLGQQVIHQDRRIRQDDALDGAMRDIALMPERDIFQRRLRIRANHPRQTADLLAIHGIALVGHGAAAPLFAAKGSSASRTSVRWRWRISRAIRSRRGGDYRQRAHELSMAVTAQNLAGDRSGCQSQSGANLILQLRPQVGAIAYRAGNLADGHLCCRERGTAPGFCGFRHTSWPASGRR